MKKFILAIPLIFVAGCASFTDSKMVRFERTLEAGNSLWQRHLNDEVEKCRAKGLETQAERLECIQPTIEENEEYQEYLGEVIEATQDYWYARAEDDNVARGLALAKLTAALVDLPPEYFKGAMKALKDLKD